MAAGSAERARPWWSGCRRPFSSRRRPRAAPPPRCPSEQMRRSIAAGIVGLLVAVATPCSPIARTPRATLDVDGDGRISRDSSAPLRIEASRPDGRRRLASRPTARYGIPMDRTRARALANESVTRGEPTAWFETLYSEAAAGSTVVPWADLVPNPHLVAWLDAHPLAPGRALDVGTGFGDNAEELARRGHRVSAFDVSATAIAHAQERFVTSAVE